MTLFLTESSFYSIFTQVLKTSNSTVALQEGLLKHLGDLSQFFWIQFVVFLHVIPDRLHVDQIRSMCGTLAVVRLLVQTKISLEYYN